jgi:AraC-like DNA-binding protein
MLGRDLRGRRRSVLLLDTVGVAPHDRADAFRTAFDIASVPCRVEVLDAVEDMHARLDLWQFGSANLFAADASGFRLVRTPKHVRMDAPPVVAVAVQVGGLGRFAQFDTERLVGSSDLMISDLTAPYSFDWTGDGGSRAFQVPYELLALPVDVVRRAAPRLAASPLHDLVHEHLRRLAGSAGELARSAAAASVGTATVELVRALLVSAADDDRLRPAARHETLLNRVQAYVGQRLTDPDLTPAAIAWTHNVSVRQLYKAFAEAGVSLEQLLLEQRLELARSRLASAPGRRRSIAATARASGFRDASHFSRRFRAAYGMTPREWQRLTAGAEN